MKLSIKKLSFDKIRRQAFYVWIRHYKLLFVFLFLLLTGFAGQQWYRYLYHYSWTPEQRKSYLDSTAKETAFQEGKFMDALNRLGEDRTRHLETRTLERDLFEGARKEDK